MNTAMFALVTFLTLGQLVNADSEAANEKSAPPLTAQQRKQIGELAKETQITERELKDQLARLQRELAAIYGTYQLDVERATAIEEKLLAVQRQLLANYRQLQVGLRTHVSEERFVILKQRLDHMLQTQQRASAAEQKTDTDRDRVASPGVADPPKAMRPDESAERIFSGPQVGEQLPPLPVVGVFDADAGVEHDFIRDAGNGPIVLVFVHEANRPSIGMTRALTAYTVDRAKEGLHTGVIWLDDDATEAEATLKRIRHALTPGAPTAISPDGKEGPGGYGLNRNVTLTILVGDKGVVTANFALVQPSLQADLPRVFAEVVRIVGGDAPKVEEAVGGRSLMREQSANGPSPELRGLLAPVIRRNATADDVDRAATAVESHVATNEVARREVGRIAKTIVGSGKLSNYGTPRAQEYLRQWAERYGDEPAGDPTGNEDRSQATESSEGPSQ